MKNMLNMCALFSLLFTSFSMVLAHEASQIECQSTDITYPTLEPKRACVELELLLFSGNQNETAELPADNKNNNCAVVSYGKEIFAVQKICADILATMDAELIATPVMIAEDKQAAMLVLADEKGHTITITATPTFHDNAEVTEVSLVVEKDGETIKAIATVEDNEIVSFTKQLQDGTVFCILFQAHIVK